MDAPSPGSVLREALADSKLTPNQLAKTMNVSPSCVWYLLHDQRGITANMARRLAVAMPGTADKPVPTAEGWLAIQAKWDLRPIVQEAGA
jgi:addiction module HigA family antidote